MSKNHHSVSGSSPRGLVKIVTFIIVSLLLLARFGHSHQTHIANPKSALLQGSIQLQPLKPIPGDQTDKIQPNTPIKLIVTVENKGQYASLPGQLYVRYAFASPLDKEVTSVLFETEKKALPAIEAGQKIDIVFDQNPHQIPSVLDFVRQDWALREYQAIAVIHQEEHLLGTLAITFSAYYYPGIKKEFPSVIFSKE